MFDRLENEVAILERHLQVLAAVAEHEPIGLVTLTNRLPYPRHKVRYSLRVLEAEALIDSTAAGVVTTDRVAEFEAQAARRLSTVTQKLDGLRPEIPSRQWTAADSAKAD